MTRPGRGLILVLAVVAVAAIPGAALAAGPHDRAAEPQLVARAVLPADTLAEGPPSGSSLGTAPINGRTPPFPGQLVQGFSALIGGGQPGVYLALADNGFGAKANSADFLLRAYRIGPHWERAGSGPGTVLYAYDLAKRRFRNWTADYFTDAPGNAIGDLTAASRDVLLLIERDNLQGAEAATKRIYELEINHLRGHAIPRTLLVDLLRIANPHLIGSPSQPGTVGLGDPFAFPFQTIESVFVLNRRTLVVANDNNYPFSAGRRPGQPDDNELIQVRLPRALPSS